MGNLSPYRTGKIGSSHIAALFGQSPYLTELQLYSHFVHGMPIDDAESERMRIGRLVQSAIVSETARKNNWTVEENLKDEWLDGQPSELRFGFTRDAAVLNHEEGPGLVETKNVDGFVFKTEWTPTKAPTHIELQVQHQLLAGESYGFEWCAIAPLVGGNRLPKPLIRRPLPKVQDRIKYRLAEFWRRVEKKDPPPAQGRIEEIPALELAFPDMDIPTPYVEAFGNVELVRLAEKYHEGKQAKAYGEGLIEEARVKLLEAAKGSVLRVNGFKVSCKRIERVMRPGVTPELQEAIEEIIANAAPERVGMVGDLARAWFDWQTQEREVSSSYRISVEPVEGDDPLIDIPYEV